MVWIFGDSFSAPLCKFYCEWKGYIPKTFGEIISEKYKTNIKNLSIAGSDNDSIFESIINNTPNIDKDDIVIIGWSSIIRFRLGSSDRNNRFVRVLPNWGNNWNDIKQTGVSKDTIDEILVNRMGYGYVEEYKNRFKFINWLFKDMMLIQWSPFKRQHDVIKITCNTIKDETNGYLNDEHYSELGHQQMSEYFISLINDDKLRQYNNNVFNKII